MDAPALGEAFRANGPRQGRERRPAAASRNLSESPMHATITGPPTAARQIIYRAKRGSCRAQARVICPVSTGQLRQRHPAATGRKTGDRLTAAASPAGPLGRVDGLSQVTV